ncbi:FMN-binding negative transcriptional regulator [Piscinibacter sp. XHJ-5]|uniref:FMN-binding negative transcriptional regulator n=1 Tax=Piscinibacter sp. XHJ-5 TaxID=3037797 RepID=UPI002453002F|nr:FMN-binding negative transcriptional regulator [Piscinibacter sp. XHJ-5]
MYTPTHFAETRPQVLHELMRAHPLGLLVTQDAGGGLDANPLPFILDADRGPHGTLRGHVARANPVWREARTDAETLIVFQGPQAYVSPSWYPSKAQGGKVVPTWNYVIVQARGRLAPIDDPVWLRRLVGELTERHEAGRPAPWRVEDAPAEYTTALLRAIVGIEIEIHSLQGKWKVSQNRPAADRDGVVQGLAAEGGDQARAMARQVQAPASGSGGIE